LVIVINSFLHICKKKKQPILLLDISEPLW